VFPNPRTPFLARDLPGATAPLMRRKTAKPFHEDLRPFERLFAEKWGSLRAETRRVPDGH